MIVRDVFGEDGDNYKFEDIKVDALELHVKSTRHSLRQRSSQRAAIIKSIKACWDTLDTPEEMRLLRFAPPPNSRPSSRAATPVMDKDFVHGLRRENSRGWLSTSHIT